MAQCPVFVRRAIDLHFLFLFFGSAPKSWDVQVDVSTCFQKKIRGFPSRSVFPGILVPKNFFTLKKKGELVSDGGTDLSEPRQHCFAT